MVNYRCLKKVLLQPYPKIALFTAFQLAEQGLLVLLSVVSQTRRWKVTTTPNNMGHLWLEPLDLSLPQNHQTQETARRVQRVLMGSAGLVGKAAAQGRLPILGDLRSQWVVLMELGSLVALGAVVVLLLMAVPIPLLVPLTVVLEVKVMTATASPQTVLAVLVVVARVIPVVLVVSQIKAAQLVDQEQAASSFSLLVGT